MGRIHHRPLHHGDRLKALLVRAECWGQGLRVCRRTPHSGKKRWHDVGGVVDLAGSVVVRRMELEAAEATGGQV